MDADGKNKRVLSLNVNLSINSFQWDSNNKGIYYSYDKFGDTKIAYMNLDGSSRDMYLLHI